jgi:hypothetical protein
MIKLYVIIYDGIDYQDILDNKVFLTKEKAQAYLDDPKNDWGRYACTLQELEVVD